MKLSVHSFLLPKAGLESYECEDSIGIGSAALRYCVADGATEGFGSRRWSKLLTKAWARSRGLLNCEEFGVFVSNLAERFDRYWRKKELPWYAEEKALKGAFAAFVGIQFHESENAMQWQSIAQGDCCIFQIRDKEIISASPLQKAEQFNNNPILIASNLNQRTDQESQLIMYQGSVEPGDHFLLMSDAVAAWFLNTVNDQDTLSMLYQLLAHDDEAVFTAFIERERNEKRLKNDDVAIVQIIAGIG